MPKGGILSITTTLLDNESMVKQFPKAHFQQYIVVTVRDTGVGMDEETQRRIFEPFFSTKDIGKGTGLGLSVVFGIMESHRGFISVDSTIENGTTFSVYLPVQTDTLHAKNELPQRGHDAESGTETILVVEDEEMLRELITTKLTSAGYSVLSAVNGRDGLEQFQQHRSLIDAVFTDMGLPLIDGVEMSKKILASAPSIILFITSGYFSPELTAELDSLGVQHRIQKPYDPAFVIKTLRTAFDAKVKHVEK
jgi:CheY-like chemotaxis protein